ncbi:MAG: 5-formyltetrahydrofolate cyclo-ligase [Ruminococcus sp.]|nr:5-formyltetrahydrofolate cyclo-ligase [Ruminococcus sp.]
MNVTNEKNLLRNKYKDIRKSYLQEVTSNHESRKTVLDRQILKNLVDHVNFKQYKAVLCYVSFGIEVDTLRLIEHLVNDGISVYAPKCYRCNNSMRFFAIDGVDSLIYGEYKGILEPIEDESTELTDFSNCLCIVPALSFDVLGYRLGWGGGYYDRFLCANKNIFKVGLVYNTCISDTLPKDIHDVSVDLVVSEENILLCGGTNEY